tara:strand:- start:480 stop:755 length:276 start_codon:yes stop_codon:yes gene_type:complete
MSEKAVTVNAVEIADGIGRKLTRWCSGRFADADTARTRFESVVTFEVDALKIDNPATNAYLRSVIVGKVKHSFPDAYEFIYPSKKKKYKIN